MPAQLFWNIGSFKFLVPSHFHIWWLKLQWPIVHKQNHNYVFWNHIHITNDQLFWNIKSTFTWVLSVDSWASHITLPMHWLRKPCERSFRKVKSTGSMFSDLLASFLLLASPVNIPIGAPWGQKFICFENYAAEPFFQQTGPLLLSQVWGCKWKPAVSFDSLSMFSSNVNNLWKGSEVSADLILWMIPCFCENVITFCLWPEMKYCESKRPKFNVRCENVPQS